MQVGNPFLEKLLMEACLELTEEHHEWIVGLQDLGAAGLTSSTVECAAKAGTGLIIDVAKVPRREDGMTPYEVMLSESQERMLVIVKPEHEANVRAVFERWELHCATIGVVTDDGVVRIHDNGVEVGAITAKMLTDAPTYVRDVVKPEWLTALQEFDLSRIPSINDGSYNGSDASERVKQTLLDLLASPEIASKRLIWRQYDHQVGTNTVVGPGSDAAVIRIKGTKKALAIATDGNAAYTCLDPVHGRSDRRRRGGAQRRLHWRPADRHDELPELRESGEAGRLLPASRGDPRNGRRRQGARDTGDQREREPVQRDERRSDMADAGRRRRRAD